MKSVSKWMELNKYTMKKQIWYVFLYNQMLDVKTLIIKHKITEDGYKVRDQGPGLGFSLEDKAEQIFWLYWGNWIGGSNGEKMEVVAEGYNMKRDS